MYVFIEHKIPASLCFLSVCFSTSAQSHQTDVNTDDLNIYGLGEIWLEFNLLKIINILLN